MAAGIAALAALASVCSSPTLLPPPRLPNISILTLTAEPVLNFSRAVPQPYNPNGAAIQVANVSFCNVTLAYIHPTQPSQVISLEAWFPPSDAWNERLQAAGGGGWGAGRFEIAYGTMAAAISEGYATVTTDAGVKDVASAKSWALTPGGAIDMVTLTNWGSVALNDMSVLGKALTAAFYGKPALYSYFAGCSQGGRQGYELAQRYPTAFDGIAAAAPAIYWPRWDPALLWAQHVMNRLGEYPPGCEFDALTNAAIAKCDGADGVKDGILADPASCAFDPFALVGTEVPCAQPGLGPTRNVSLAAAKVANATWTGPRTQFGAFQWFGYELGADISGLTWGSGPASTTCTAAAAAPGKQSCKGNPFAIAYEWIQLFLRRDPVYDYSEMSGADWDAMMAASPVLFDEVVGSANPDLKAFRDAGGKMITFHGLADGIIPPRGTSYYYDTVSALLPDVSTFYRYFEAPGVGHCFGGPGGHPTTTFAALRAWVENGTAPDTLPVSFPVGGVANARILCPYPKRAVFSKVCGNSEKAECFACQ